MKKTFLCSLLIGMVIVCDSFGKGAVDCSRTFTWWSNDWNAGSNEYLFKTEYDYLATVNNGHFYKCGDQCADCCRGGSYIKMKSGHVYQGFIVDEERYYKCKTTGTNQWQQIDAGAVSGLTLCANQAKIGNGTFRNEEAKRYLFPTKSDYEHMKHNTSGSVYECDKQNCTFGTIVTMPAGHYFGRNKINTQRRYKCQNGDFWDDITDDCSDCDKKDDVVTKKTCEERFKGYPERIACCKWPNSVATWNGQNVPPYKGTCNCVDPTKVWNGKKCVNKENKSCKELYAGNEKAIACCEEEMKDDGVAYWDDKGNRCNCKDETKNWDYEKKQCIAPKTDTDETEMSDCYYQFNMDITCSDSRKSYHRNTQRQLTKAEAESFGCKSGNVFDTGFKEFASFNDIAQAEAKNIEAAKRLQKLVCGDNGSNYVVVNPITPNVTPQGPNEKEVKAAADKLSAFAVSAESNRNVWKDAEGKFNTARLASDLTAGVVLGTVGGVVSGVVIKKKQVQKGFEALHCTVGGQTIADWGDDFSVGLR